MANAGGSYRIEDGKKILIERTGETVVVAKSEKTEKSKTKKPEVNNHAVS